MSIPLDKPPSVGDSKVSALNDVDEILISDVGPCKANDPRIQQESASPRSGGDPRVAGGDPRFAGRCPRVAGGVADSRLADDAATTTEQRVASGDGLAPSHDVASPEPSGSVPAVCGDGLALEPELDPPLKLPVRRYRGKKRRTTLELTEDGASSLAPDSPSSVIDAYREYHPRYRPNTRVEKLIRSRLEDGFAMRELIDAIHGCHMSPFHCGDNDRGQRYQSLDLILRNADKVTQFLEIKEAADQAKKATTAKKDKHGVTQRIRRLLDEEG
jgi:hypothetical protein